MKWNNLKNTKCPQCSHALVYDDKTHTLTCTCGFRISELKFSELTTKIVSDEIVEDHKNEEYIDESGNIVEK